MLDNTFRDEIYVVGASWLPIDDSTVWQLDESVFAACQMALSNAGVRRHQIGLSVTSSLDLYDARSISSALTAPAAAGYLTDELRIEGDSGKALLVAAAGLAAGTTEYAIVVAIHAPEVGSADERVVREIDEHVSSYTFDAHTDRPVGMTATVTLGLHASSRLENGAVTVDEMIARTTSDINRGAAKRGVRSSVRPSDVRDSPMAVTPLTELMLPASSTGVAVLVLAGGIAGRRSLRPLARLTGWGLATASGTANGSWLRDPYAATAAACQRAYAMAGVTDPPAQVSTVEMTDLSPALSDQLQTALQLSGIDDDAVNPSGGVRSSHPGVASGLMRIIDATDTLADSPSHAQAVVHSTDDLCGLISSTSTVLVLEAL